MRKIKRKKDLSILDDIVVGFRNSKHTLELCMGEKPSKIEKNYKIVIK